MAGFAQARNALFSGLVGDASFFDSTDTGSPGSEIDLISETVGAGKKWNLTRVSINCSMSGKIRVFKDANLIGSGYTSPGNLNFDFSWFPFREAAAGEVVAVKFTQRSGGPAAEVRSHLQFTEQDA